jgi:hypothetical protein
MTAFLLSAECLVRSIAAGYFLMMPSDLRRSFGGTSIVLANSIVYVARPWLIERTVVA